MGTPQKSSVVSQESKPLSKISTVQFKVHYLAALLRYSVLRILNLSKATQEEAASEILVFPNQQGLHRQKAHYLESHLSRIKDTVIGSIEYSIGEMQAGKMTVYPVRFARFENALVAGSRILSTQYRSGRIFSREIDSTPRMGPLVLIYEPNAPKFGHFVRIDLLLRSISKELLPSATVTNLGAAVYQHAADYESLLELQCKQFLHAIGAPLYVPLNPGSFRGTLRKKHLIEIRRKLRAQISAPAIKDQVVYLRRSDDVQRTVRNEGELIEALNPVIIDTELASMEEIAKALRSAEVVIGMEGSQLAHAWCWMDEGTALIVIMPPYRFVTVHKEACDHVNIQFGFVVGEGTRDNFTVEPDSIKELIDRMT